MKETNNKLHALLFALFMATSVFAGSIAFAGSAAAVDNTDIDTTQGPVEYTAPNGQTIVDVTFNQSANAGSFVLLDKDGNNVGNFNINAGGTANVQEGGIVSLQNNLDEPTVTRSGVRFNLGQNSDLSGDATLQVTGDGTNTFTDPVNFTITTTSVTLADGKTHVTSDGSTEDGQSAVAYVGSNVAVLSGNAPNSVTSEAYEISTEGTFVRSGDAGDEFIVNVEDTSDLVAGTTYNFTFGGESTSNAAITETLEMRSLGLTATADSTSVDKNEDESSVQIDAEVTSTVQGRSVTAELINSSDEVANTQTTSIGGDRSVDVTFDVDSTDTYTIRVTDDNTNITAETDEIVVSEVTGTASFTESVFRQERGDIAEFSIELTNTESATVNVGGKAGQSDINYNATLDVNDTSGDGVVTVQLNTFAPNSNNAVTLANDDDEITSGATTDGTAAPLDAGTYDLNVSVGGEEQALSTLSLTALSADGFTIFTAPPVTDISSADSSSDYDAFEAAGNLTTASKIASGDLVVHKIEASGLGGLLADQSGSGDNPEADFQNMLETGNMNLNVTQTDASTAPNRDPKVLLNSEDSIDNGPTSYDQLTNVNVVSDDTNDTYYFSFDIAVGDQVIDGRSVADGDAFVSNLTLLEGELFDDDVSVTQTFTVEDQSVDLVKTGEDADGTDIITVASATGQTVTGETNLAPGTEVEVRARSTGEDPFLLSQSVDVDANRNFEATFDFSDLTPDQNFTFTAAGDEIDGRLVEQVSETPEPTATPAPTEEPTATPEPTATATEEPTATETPGQPGFGVIVALLAFMAAALLAIRRD